MLLTMEEARKDLKKAFQDSEGKPLVKISKPGTNESAILQRPEIPANVTPGVWRVEVIDSGETVADFQFSVDQPAKAPESDFQFSAGGEMVPASVMNATIKRQDEFYRESINRMDQQHREEMTRLRNRHDDDLKALKEKYEFKIETIEGRWKTLEDEREKLREDAKRQFAREARAASKNGDFDMGKIMDLASNPIALNIAARVMGIDLSALDAFGTGGDANV